MEHLIWIDCANAIALLFNTYFQGGLESHIHHWMNTYQLESTAEELQKLFRISPPTFDVAQTYLNK